MPNSSDIVLFFQNYYESWGYFLVFMGALTENIFPIGYLIPGSTIVWLGAFYSQTSSLSFYAVLIFGILGAFLGHNIDYIMGRTGWYLIFKRLVSEKKLKQSKKYFLKGNLFEAYFVYLVGLTRSILIIAMGVFKVNYRRFFPFALIAAVSWNIVFVLFGYTVGRNRFLLESGLNLLWSLGFILLVPYLVIKLYNFKKGNNSF